MIACMASIVSVVVTDDLDGSDNAETVSFGLDGVSYEIDLSAKHTEELRKLLANYAAHGRKAGGTTRRTPRGRRSGTDAVDTARVREWAKGNGYDIKERGRVPANVVEKHKAAVGT